MLVTGLGVSEEERMRDLRAFQTGSCEKTKEYLMNYSEPSFLHENFASCLWVQFRSSCGVHAKTPQSVWMRGACVKRLLRTLRLDEGGRIQP